MEASVAAPPADAGTQDKPKAETKATPPKAANGTEFTVLRLIEVTASEDGTTGKAWVEVAEDTAPTKDLAIKAVAGEEEGIWKGVPNRSWKGAIQTAPEKVVKVTTKALDI